MTNRGFTIIETFVAITILLVAVLGPLSTLGRAIADETYLKNQLIASYLAQEGLELVINKKDNNMVKKNAPDGATSTDWLAGLRGCVNQNGCAPYKDNGQWIFSVLEEGGNVSQNICYLDNPADAIIYQNCPTGNSGGVRTNLTRVITISDPVEIDEYDGVKKSKAQVTSTVTWTGRGGRSTMVSLSTWLYEYAGNNF